MSYSLKAKDPAGQNYVLIEGTTTIGNGDAFTVAELTLITSAIGIDLSDGQEVTLKVTGADNKVTINDATVKGITRLAILAYGA